MSLERLTTALADRYRIERELGQGGMATVYLAADLKHHRRVAIKVLHPELSAVLGSERFLKEIELTANLQHPHVLPLFDSGEADGQLYYVMPMVEGETLRSRLEREHQLAVADAVRIAADVADALDYAHRHGVVHRDIKPENILLHDGRPLVADFGIALAVQQAGGTRMTQTGMSLGTPQYMAPEQAMGDKAVDHRADIYALGAVTYEMLAGEPPFTGHSSQAIVARVLTERPRALTTLRDTVPRHVAEAVHMALQKLAADRFPSAAEFARALGDPGFRTTAAVPAVAGMGERERRVAPATLALGGIALALAALAAWGWLRPQAEGAAPRSAWRIPLPVPDSAPVTSALSLSDDGGTLVYGGGRPGDRRIWIWRAGSLTPAPIEGTEAGHNPASSPDGRRVAFQRGPATIYVIPAEGGRATAVADSVVLRGQPAWLDDEHLVFANQSGLERVDVRGGAREPVTRVDSAAGEGLHLNPSAVPDGDGIVFSVRQAAVDDPSKDSIAVTLPGGAYAMLTDGTRAHYAHPDHLIVLRADGTLVAQPFDVSTRRITGPGRTVATGVLVAQFDRRFAVSRSGRLAYLTGRTGDAEIVRVARDGRAAAVDSGWVEQFISLAASPDGRRVAAQIRTRTTEELQVRDLATGGFARIALPGLQLRYPSFSADGRTVFFSAASAGGMYIYRLRTGSSAAPERLLTVDDIPSGASPLPDGGTFFYSTFRGRSGDLFAYQLDTPNARPRTFLAGLAKESFPAVSPDGRWLAYLSEETGRPEVFVRSTDGTRAEQWQVSRSGAPGSLKPHWSPDGRELYYVSRDSLVAARVATGEAFAVTGQAALFPMTAYTDFDVLPGGDFLMIHPRPLARDALRLVLVEDWKTAVLQ